MLHQHQEPENQHLPLILETSEPQTADAPTHAPTLIPISIETEERTPDSAHVLYSLELDAPTETATFRPIALSKSVLKDFQTVKTVRRAASVVGTIYVIYAIILRHFVEGFLHYRGLDLSIVILCILMALMFGVRHISKPASKRLSRLNDPRMVAPLLDAYATHPSSYVAIALIRLFPQMTQMDARYLSTENKQQIYQLIGQRVGEFYLLPGTRERQIQLRIATLKALERIGTREAAPIVKTLIVNTKEPRIREAAERCLPYLKMRPLESEASLSLLRSSSASDVNEVADPTLLRPATDTDQSADELLRPG